MQRARPQVTPVDDTLVRALLQPAAFDHPADDVELVETHISWVILAGDFAYKIKKPLVLDFLDFGTLDRRKFCCEEEIRLNRPWAPDVYIGVIAITTQDGHPCFGGSGETLEYAVKMRRFDQELRLDEQLAAGLLTVADMKELGRNIADRHAAADVAAVSDRQRLVEQAKRFVGENFTHLDGVIDPGQFEFLRNWTTQQLETLDTRFWQRFDEGFVRDCHGDLHLGNLVRLPGGITTFDCIEFNPDLRFTDVFADVGFLTMDLVDKGRHDLAAHFVNRYLECSGDYAGVVLHDFYFVYRCLVRAKVAAIRSRERASEQDRNTDIAEAREYCEIARRQATKGPRALVIMSGLSGSGKSWVSERLMAELPAIRLRSDTERKRLFGLAETEQSGSGIATGIYTAEATAKTYDRLFELAGEVFVSGHHVILDAAFLNSAQRDAAKRMAKRAGCEPVLLHVRASTAVLKERLRQRAGVKGEVSEADLDVLEHQLENADPLTTTESATAVIIDAFHELDVRHLVASIREKLRKN